MNTQRLMTQPTLLQTRILAGGMLVLAALLPQKLNNIRVISFSDPLTIQTRKTEPPRIAFDQGVAMTTAEKWMPDAGFERLASGPPEKIKVQVRPMVISRQDSSLLDRNEREVAAAPSASDTIYRHLTPAQASRLSIANERSDVLNQNWREPTWKDVIQKEIAEIKNQDPTVVRAANSNLVRGSILLTGGLPNPNLNNAQLVIRRESEGISKEYGQTNAVDASYSIQVDQFEGYLVAELFDRQRNLLGEGRARLSKFQQQGPQLVVHAVQSRSPLSFYDYEKEGEQGRGRGVAKVSSSPTTRRRSTPGAANSPTRGGQTTVASNTLGAKGLTDDDGDFNPGKVSANSWFMARTQASGRAESLFLLNGGEEHHLPQFESSFVQSVLEIIQQQLSTRLDLAEGGVIWGRITQDSKPLIGAKVEVENQPDAVVVYLNELMIPDLNMKVSSSNGYFVVVNLNSGWTALVSKVGNANHSYTNVVVDQGAISPAILTNQLGKEDVPVRVYDALSGTAEAATIQAQNLESELYVNGLSQVQLPNLRRQALVRVLPEDQMYAEYQTIHSDHLDYWHLPLVKTEWIQQLRASQQISDSSSTAVIVGFVPNDNFEAFLPNEEDYDAHNVVYFDANGFVTERGVLGGGFVMFNVPQGVQSITLVNTQDMISSQVIPVDPGSLSVFKFSF